jgi:hypothetical protein
MRSASKVARASSIACSGSLSPTAPDASTPASFKRSTVASCTSSACAIASSTSETQKRSAECVVAGEITSTSASRGRTPVTSRNKSDEMGSAVLTRMRVDVSGIVVAALLAGLRWQTGLARGAFIRVEHVVGHLLARGLLRQLVGRLGVVGHRLGLPGHGPTYRSAR